MHFYKYLGYLLTLLKLNSIATLVGTILCELLEVRGVKELGYSWAYSRSAWINLTYARINY